MHMYLLVFYIFLCFWTPGDIRIHCGKDGNSKATQTSQMCSAGLSLGSQFSTETGIWFMYFNCVCV